MALLSGIAPANAVGAVTVKLQAKDNGNAMTAQDYTLRINTRPVVGDFSLALEEDEVKVIGVLPFAGAFTDVDGDALQKIKIVKLPAKGQLLLSNQVVSLDQEIDISATNSLAYQPQQDFFGKDTVEWKGADALSFSANSAKIFISVSPINDPPVIVNLEQTVLEFSVGEGPGIISTAFEVMDVDNETLVSAEIRFRQNFVPGVDILYFTNTSKITGVYDPETGILMLTGVATVAEYNEAIRSITYDNISEVFSDAEVTKTISYTVGDGTVLSETRDRQIKLIDLFEEITIPNGFTPNNDPANDTWVITNIERYTEAVVKVFNIRGQEVYSSEGVYAEWDGMSRGEPLPSDTYYYTIDLRLPFRKKVYKGAVTILR
jgi:gliding motility-associated-like protein